MRPLLRDLFLRKRRDVTNSAVLPRRSSHLPNPRRRAGGSTSDLSVIPAAAAPAAPAIPIAIAVSAATANSERSRAISRRSNTIATVQAPAGTSLRTTCKGSPNQVPFKKFLIFCAAGRPPAYRALSRAFCNLSSTGSCGAGVDESPIGSTFMPESSSTFDLSFYSLSRLLLDPDPNGIKDQFVTCAVYELRLNCGRPVTGFPGQLRLHPALDELGWIGVTDEFNEAAGLTNQSLPEPILITTNGTILAGIGCWRAAGFYGQQELNCIRS